MDEVDELEAPEVITSDTENATQVRPEEAPPDKKYKYRKFKAYNTGLWNGPKRENTEVIRRQDDLHTFDSLSSSLSLTDYQQNRGRRVFDDLNFHEIGEPVEVIAFGVCCAVANADVTDGTRYWPHPDATGDKDFERVAESLGIEQRKQLSIVQKVMARSDLYDGTGNGTN